MTRAMLAELFMSLGLRPAMSVMVHAGLSGIGYLPNGPCDVIDAVLDVLGPEGTMLVPTHSGQLTDPAEWRNPPVPAAWIDILRREMTPFDPQRTPVRNRGVLPENFLRCPGVRRSDHPLNSTAALGARAAHFTATHPIDESEGVDSPCHKLYLAGGHVLLIGTGLESCTALHVAEFIADVPYLRQNRMKVLVRGPDGGNVFHRLQKYPGSSRHFEKLRPLLAAADALSETSIGGYRFTLLALRPTIDLILARLESEPEWLIRPA